MRWLNREKRIRRRVLLTNDEGYGAEGLTALRAALIGAGFDPLTIVPDTDRSASGRRVTVREKVILRRVDADLAHQVWTASGTPADCARIGLLADYFPVPDILISGVHHGVNLGDDVSYSGTVGAAAESALLGTPAIAVSQAGPVRRATFLPEHPTAFLHLDFVTGLAQRICDHPLDSGLFLNVNIPSQVTTAAAVAAHPGNRLWRDVAVSWQERDRDLEVTMWGSDPEPVLDDGSDFAVLHSGRIAVTAMLALGGLRDASYRLDLSSLIR